MRPTISVLCGALLAVATAAGAQDQTRVSGLVDRVAARLIPANGPGCTIGVRLAATPPVTRAFGAADLERAVPLTPASILEAGSVSKQFTAASITLLAIEGKLSFDDDVRRWFPELPDYGTRITVRHLLTHTSGLRDWGNIAGMEGWPRGTRAHTNDNVLEIAARQRALNYKPGSAYSYTNTGFNLLALLVQRASGKTLAEFSRERLFEPLGMKNTSWRDNYERIVPGRALAYAGGRGNFTTDMPNENAYGNGGLLTTVGDLLIWNDAMNGAALGTPLADSVVKQFVLTNGRVSDYALGLFISHARGTLEIQHSGSTAGYRAHLVRFPDDSVSVAVLCNAGGAINATTVAYQIADSLLKSPGPGESRDGGATPPVDPAKFAGIWVNELHHTPVRLTVVDGRLRRGNVAMLPAGANVFIDGPNTTRFSNERDGRPTRMLLIPANADTATFRREEEWRPGAAELGTFQGSFATPEVHGEPFRVVIESGAVYLRQGPTTRAAMAPIYRDAFAAGARIVWFTRDARGSITTMHLSEDRAWDVAFAKKP